MSQLIWYWYTSVQISVTRTWFQEELLFIEIDVKLKYMSWPSPITNCCLTLVASSILCWHPPNDHSQVSHPVLYYSIIHPWSTVLLWATDSRHTSTSYTLIEKEPYFQVGCWFSRKSQCTNVQIDRYSIACIGTVLITMEGYHQLSSLMMMPC